ncbi:PTS galactitol transporter subunit IIC, partial [Anaerostipes caccae]|uniref:PTS transporter subunit IIC n=1 Tax=Anaerostipes caccae TaxID=105841 RepID=UPI0027D3269D
DVALGLGDPPCITCTAISIPITILFAFIIPNMVYFPIGLLGIVCYTTVMCVLASKGNLLRSLICSIASMFLITFFVNMFVHSGTNILTKNVIRNMDAME